MVSDLTGRHAPARTQVLFVALASYAEEITSPGYLDGEFLALDLLQGMRGYFFILVGNRWSREEEEALRTAFGLDHLVGPGPFQLQGNPKFLFNPTLNGTPLFDGMVGRVVRTLRDTVSLPGWENIVVQHASNVSSARNMEELTGLDPGLQRDRGRMQAFHSYTQCFWGR